MEDFSEWITERTVMFTSIVGLSGETFDIGDRVFVITLFLIAVTVHVVMWLLAPVGSSSSITSFEERARAEREEMLDLMKQRIEEANRPVVKSAELENAEKATAAAKQSLQAKQNDYTQEKG